MVYSIIFKKKTTFFNEHLTNESKYVCSSKGDSDIQRRLLSSGPASKGRSHFYTAEIAGISGLFLENFFDVQHRFKYLHKMTHRS